MNELMRAEFENKYFIVIQRTYKTMAKGKNKNKNRNKSNTKQQQSATKSQTNHQQPEQNEEQEVKPQMGQLANSISQQKGEYLKVEKLKVSSEAKGEEKAEQQTNKQAELGDIIKNDPCLDSQTHEGGEKLPILRFEQSIVAITVPQDESVSSMVVSEDTSIVISSLQQSVTRQVVISQEMQQAEPAVQICAEQMKQNPSDCVQEDQNERVNVNQKSEILEQTSNPQGNLQNDHPAEPDQMIADQINSNSPTKIDKEPEEIKQEPAKVEQRPVEIKQEPVKVDQKPVEISQGLLASIGHESSHQKQANEQQANEDKSEWLAYEADKNKSVQEVKQEQLNIEYQTPNPQFLQDQQHNCIQDLPISEIQPEQAPNPPHFQPAHEQIKPNREQMQQQEPTKQEQQPPKQQQQETPQQEQEPPKQQQETPQQQQEPPKAQQETPRQQQETPRQQQEKSQEWLSQSKKLSYPIICTRESPSRGSEQIATPTFVHPNTELLAQEENPLQKQQKPIMQEQQQNQPLESSANNLAQISESMRMSGKKESFIDMLRESKLQEAEQEASMHEQRQYNVQGETFAEMKSTSITHQIISSSSLKPLSPQTSMMKFILIPDNANSLQRYQVQQGSEQRHLIRDQTQQRLASEESLQNIGQPQRSEFTSGQMKHQAISMQGLQQELENIKNDIQMAQILSNYEIQSKTIFSEASNQCNQIIEPFQPDNQSNQIIEPFQPEQLLSEAIGILSTLVEAPISQPALHQQLIQASVYQQYIQASVQEENPVPVQAQPHCTTKVDRIKMFFEKNSKIVEEIEMEDAEQLEHLEGDHHERLAVSHSRSSLTDNSDAMQMNTVVEKGSDEQEPIEDNHVQIQPNEAIQVSQQPQKQEQDPKHEQYPKYEQDPIISYSQSFQVPIFHQPTATIAQILPTSQQQTALIIEATPHNSQLDFSDYQMRQSSVINYEESPQKNLEPLKQKEEEKLNVSAEYDSQGNIVQEQVQKDQQSPVLYKVRANQMLHHLVQEQGSLVQPYENADANAHTQFRLGIQRIPTIGHEERVECQDDDMHDPPNSPVNIRCTQPGSINEDLELKIIEESGICHESNQQQSIKIHHLGGSHHSPHVSLSLEHQQNPQYHQQPYLIHHLHPRIIPTNIHPLSSSSQQPSSKSIINMIDNISVSIKGEEEGDSGLLNRLEEVVSEHMISEGCIDVPEGYIGNEVNEAYSQHLLSQQPIDEIRREQDQRQNEFLKKITMQQQSYKTIANQTSIKHQAITHEPIHQQNQPNPITPERPQQEPHNQTVVHSIVRQWNPYNNPITANYQSNHTQSHHTHSQFNDHHHPVMSYESPQRPSHPNYQTFNNEHPAHNNEHPAHNNEHQWRPSHRDTIIDALNDIDSDDLQLAAIRQQTATQPSQFTLQEPQSQYQHSQVNHTIMESFAPLVSEETQPLVRTLTSDSHQEVMLEGSKQNSASMPFLNSKPSDRYRQFINDDSAQKQVEESRNVGPYALPIVLNDNTETRVELQSTTPIKQLDPTKPSQTVIPTNTITNTHLYSQQSPSHQQSKPTTQPVVFTMQEYKKRFNSYSFAKPKTNIISLGQIQKQTVTGGNESVSIMRVEVVRKVSEVISAGGEGKYIAAERMKSPATEGMKSQVTEGMKSPATETMKSPATERVWKAEVEMKAEVQNGIDQLNTESITHHISLQQSSQTSISPPTIPSQGSHRFHQTTYQPTPSTFQPIRQANNQTAHSTEVTKPSNIQPAYITETETVEIMPIPLTQSVYVPARASYETSKEDAKAREELSESQTLVEQMKDGCDSNKAMSVGDSILDPSLLDANSHPQNNQTHNHKHDRHQNYILAQQSLEDRPKQLVRTEEPVQILRKLEDNVLTNQNMSLIEPTSYHAQFFTSYSQGIPQSQSYHTSADIISLNFATQQQPNHQATHHLHSSPVVSVPHQLTKQFQLSNPNPAVIAYQEQQINERNIIEEKLPRSRERSREKTKVVFRFPLNSPKPTNKSSNHEFSSQSNKDQTIKDQTSKGSVVERNDHGNENVQLSSFIPGYDRQMFNKYAKYETYTSNEPQNLSTPKPYHKQANVYQQRPLYQQHTNMSPASNKHPIPKPVPSNQHFQTGPRGNTNSGSKPKTSNHTLSPTYHNNTFTPKYNLTKFSQPLNSQLPSNQYQNFSQSLQKQHLRLNHSKQDKRNSKGKKQKICLTLKRDYLQKPQPHAGNMIKYAVDDKEKTRTKLKQVKLARQTEEGQVSPHLIRKEYKQKKFMKIQKFSTNETYQHKDQSIKKQSEANSKQIRPSQNELPNDNLSFTRLFSFLDKPGNPSPIPQKQFTFISQQKSEQLPSKTHRKYIDTVNNLHKRENQPKQVTQKLLSIGRKPQQTFKTEHFAKHGVGEYLLADRTGSKTIEAEAEGLEELKGFVRSKLVLNQQVKREILPNPNLDDSFSDVENEEAPRMNR